MPGSFCFVHASDAHLDVPFRDLRRASPAVTQAMCRAPLAAWDALVRLTIEQDAAFLLLAGDVCDEAARAVAAQFHLRAGLERLAARGISTFIVGGGADKPARWAGIHTWPDGVHCFDSDHGESVAVTRAGERVATIHGIAGEFDLAAGRLAAQCQRGPEPGVHIGLLHASVEPAESHSSRRWCRPDDLQAAGMDYWALGHDHQRRRVSQAGPPIVYSGTLQGRGFAADEIGPKGAEVVHVRDGVVGDSTFHALDSVRLVTAEVEASSDVPGVGRALRERAAALREEHAGHNLVVRAVLRGQRPAGAGGWSGGPRERMLQELRGHDTEAQTFVWWDSVLDLTEPVMRDERREDAACGHVRALADTLRRHPEKLDDFLADQVAPLAGPGVLVSEPRLDRVEVNALLTQATHMAVDLLTREQS